MQQLGDRYRAARDFAPRVLATLKLRANPDGEQLLEAVEVLRDLNRRGVRRVPDDAPVGFVPRSWRPYVHSPDGAIDRHHWELCLPSELPSALRAGEIWVPGSRRYTDPKRLPHIPQRLADRGTADLAPALAGASCSPLTIHRSAPR